MRTPSMIQQPDPADAQANAKVTREDWLQLALDILVKDGIAEVKILRLAEQLNVSRSSFYWYFSDRKALLDALIAHWDQTNTGPIQRHADAPKPTVTAAVAHVFRCFIDPSLFSPTLDFAVREWSRRDADVRTALDAADAARVEALTRMFARYDYTADQAYVRARVLYYMQIGYYSLELYEPLSERLARTKEYIFAYTGLYPSDAELHQIEAFGAAFMPNPD